MTSQQKQLNILIEKFKNQPLSYVSMYFALAIYQFVL